MVSERRLQLRRRVLRTARLRFATGTIECVVRNISPEGAAIDVDGAVLLPENFILEIATEELIVSCAIVWRSEKRAGVRFESSQIARPGKLSASSEPQQFLAYEPVRLKVEHCGADELSGTLEADLEN